MWRFKRWHCHRQSGRLRQQNRQLNTRPKTRAQSGSQDYILFLYPSVQPGKKLISVHRLNFGRFREGRSRTKIGTAFDRPPPLRVQNWPSTLLFSTRSVSVCIFWPQHFCVKQNNTHGWIPESLGGPWHIPQLGDERCCCLDRTRQSSHAWEICRYS